MALSTTTQDMKLAIVALGLGKVSLIMVNCAANLVIQVPTLLFQTDLVPDGRAGSKSRWDLRNGDAGWYETNDLYTGIYLFIYLLIIQRGARGLWPL